KIAEATNAPIQARRIAATPSECRMVPTPPRTMSATIAWAMLRVATRSERRKAMNIESSKIAKTDTTFSARNTNAYDGETTKKRNWPKKTADRMRKPEAKIIALAAANVIATLKRSDRCRLWRGRSNVTAAPIPSRAIWEQRRIAEIAP